MLRFFKKKTNDISKSVDMTSSYVDLTRTQSRNASVGYFKLSGLDVQKEELEAMFSGGSSFAGRVVTSVVDDALMYWREFKHPDENVVHIIQEAEEKQKVKKIIREAIVNARLYGGSFIIPITKSTEHKQKLQNPLNYDTIEQDSIIQYRILDRYRVYKVELQTMDPLRSDYMNPSIVTIAEGSYPMNVNRMIKIDGSYTPDILYQKNSFWHYSSLLEVYEILSNIAKIENEMMATSRKANYDVVKVGRFKTLAADEQGQQILSLYADRLAKNQSAFNVTFLDAEDNYEKFSADFTPYLLSLEHQIKVLSGITGIPMTKLMGEQQKGMNSSGNAQNDEINYTNQVKQFQENILKHVLEDFDEFFLRDLFGGKEYERIRKELIWEFPKPKFEDEETDALIKEKKSNMYITLATTGLISPEEAREMLIKDNILDIEIANVFKFKPELKLGQEAGNSPSSGNKPQGNNNAK